MPVFTLKTSRGGRPKTFQGLQALLYAVEDDLRSKVAGMGAGKIIIEIKPDERRKL